MYRLDLEKNDVEPFHYLISNTKHIITFINAKLPDDGSSRIGLTIHVQLCKPLEGERVVVYFHTRMERFGHEVIEDDYNHFVDQLISQLNIYCTAGSGWVVESLLAVEIKVAAPIRETGSSYIETPASQWPTKKHIECEEQTGRVLLSVFCIGGLVSSKEEC